MQLVIPACCAIVAAGPFPYSGYSAPVIACTFGSTAAVAMLNDAVKKGGLFASSSVGGLSGAFIPVSEDAALADDVALLADAEGLPAHGAAALARRGT